MRHEPALDGLRGVACLSVLLGHASAPFMRGGMGGVDVFFVLSGFLITSLLVAQHKAQGIDLMGFWRKRAVRLLPPLLVMVLIYVAVAPALFPRVAAYRWRDAGLALTYSMNYWMADHKYTSGLAQCWSLAVEEHFYIFWPFFVPVIAQFRRPALILGLLWAILTSVRSVAALGAPSWQAVYYPTHLHAAGLILGAALAFSRPPAWIGPVGLGALAAQLTTFHFEGVGSIAWGAPLIELASAATIAGALAEGSMVYKVLCSIGLPRVGTVSYGIYLWHWPVWLLLGPVPAPLAMLLTLVSAIGLAELSFHTVERWAKRWRSHPTTRSLATSGLGERV